MTRPRLPLLAAIAALVLAGAACSSGSDAGSGDAPPRLEAAFASYDVAAGAEQRVTVGLLTNDSRVVAFGTVGLTLEGPGGETLEAEGRFIPIPGTATEGDTPKVVRPSEGNGVYGADVTFPQPGPWTLIADVALDGGDAEAETAFIVLAEHQVPAIGDAAPATANPIIGDPGVPNSALDSRAIDDQPIPDTGLHDTRISDALAAGRPMLVVVSTPVYCVSQFCGPITEEVEKLSIEFGDDLAFVHLEVWADYEAKAVNDAAADWIFPRNGGEASEPWVFLIDGTGTIVDRWDNVASTAEMRAGIESLVG